jgi:hypothetical protein
VTIAAVVASFVVSIVLTLFSSIPTKPVQDPPGLILPHSRSGAVTKE